MTIRHKKWFNPLKDEEVLWYSHPSFIKHLPKFLFGLMISLLGIILPVYTYFFMDVPTEVSQLLVLLTVCGVVYFLWEMLVFKNTVYVITNRRVIKKNGVVGRDSSSKPHREIVRVDVTVKTIDAIISRLTSENIGDMVVRTSDDSGEEFLLAQIPEIELAESFMDRYSGTDLSSDPSLHGSSTHVEQSTQTDQQQSNHIKDSNQSQSHTSETPNKQPDQQNSNENEGVTKTPTQQNTDQTDQWDDLDEYEPSEHA